MPIRMSGLISGLDTDAVVKELMSAQSMKKTKVQQKKTKEEWKQDKWKELNTKLYALYTEQVSKLKLQGSYMTKKVTSSNESAITATATTTAATGSHTVQVKQLASSQYVTSGQLDKGTTASSKLVESGFATEGSVITVKNGGTTKYLKVDGSTTTVRDLVTTLQSAGLNASFDENQRRFFISSKESGKENEFFITSVSANSPLAEAKNNLESNAAAGTVSNEILTKFYSDYANAVELEVKDESAITALEEQLVVDAKAAKTAELKEAATKKVAEDYASNLKESKSGADYTAAIDSLAEKYTTTTDENGKTVYTDEIKTRAKAKINGDEIQARAEAAIKAEEETGVVYTDEEKVAAIKAKYEEYYAAEMETAVQTLYEEDLDAALAEKGKAYAASEAGQTEITGILESKASEIEAVETNVKAALVQYRTALESAGTSTTNVAGTDLAGLKLTEASGASVIKAQDSIIVLDGAELTGTSNTFTAAGITFDLKGTTTPAKKDDAGNEITPAQTITLNVSNDVDAVYDSIKGFFKEYNNILKEMNTLYNAGSSRGYEPLTDEEKEAMSDDQIELWENKIKDSLLRRDSTLGNLISAMKSAMQTSVEVDGERYSLSSFGIMTSTDWTEGGLLHIYGDKDDAIYSSNADKLKEALTTDPDTVIETLSTVIGKLSETMADKMKKTSLSSALTFYNDTQIKNSIKDYEDDIRKWEDRLKDMEDRYYKQFSAMESAMAKLQSQSSYLSNLMGTGQ